MDYIPTSDGKKISWFQNIYNNIAEEGPKFGLDNDQITEVQAICKSGMNKIYLVKSTWATYKGAKEYRDTMNTGNGEIKVMRTKIGQWKTADGFTSSIGTALNIIGENTSVDFTHYKATLFVAVTGDMVRLRFKKLGAEGVNIYKRKNGDMEWTFLTRATSSPYNDSIKLAVPGQPEHWEYVAYGVKKDAQIGSPSNIIQIVYSGFA